MHSKLFVNRTTSFCTFLKFLPTAQVSFTRPVSNKPTQNISLSNQRFSNALVEKETILKLLNSLNNRREVDLCLKYINDSSGLLQNKIIVIKVGGALINDPEELDILCNNLSFLQHLGFCPIVVHGAGPQLNKLLEVNKVEPQYIEGIRITDGKTLEVARGVFQSENLKLVEKLEALKCRARPLNGGVFLAEYLNKDKYKFVGNVYDVDVSLIYSSIKAGAIPVLTSLAESKDGQILNVNADVAANKIAQKLNPIKVVYLNDKGGLINERTKQLIKTVNLSTSDYTNLMKEEWVRYGTKLKLLQIKELMDTMPKTSTVSIVKAKDLAREIFSSDSLGTMFKRGTLLTIKKLSDITKDEENHLSKIIDIKQNGSDIHKSDVIYDSLYQVAALVVNDYDNNTDIALMKEFEVLKDASERETLKEEMFSQIVTKYRNLIWTTQNNNNDMLLAWYFDRSKGSFNIGSNKTLFWTGEKLKNIELITMIIKKFSELDASSSMSYQTAPLIRNTKRFYSGSTSKAINVGLIGARGHTGQELIKLIDNHPILNLKYISSRENENKLLENYKKDKLHYKNIKPDEISSYSEGVDVWIMALPNSICSPFVEQLEKYNLDAPKKVAVLDLSADYRFDSKWYYGLNELYSIEEYLKSTSQTNVLKISNPGCYATGTQLGLYPILKYLNDHTVTACVFGVSGFSGAGTKPSKNNDPENVKDNLIPYKLSNHIHELEARRHLKHKGVYFTPHVGPFFRGINITTMIPLPSSSSFGLNNEQFCDLYRDFYKEKELIKISSEVPNLKDVQNRHIVQIGGFDVSTDKHGNQRLTIISQIDNLLKGAATQAIQNINLAFGITRDKNDKCGLAGIPLN